MVMVQAENAWLGKGPLNERQKERPAERRSLVSH